MPTWSTIVSFHPGDMATIWGFKGGLSTETFAPEEGAPGYQGFTIHSEVNGEGSGVVTSLTFAGIDPAAAAHFSIGPPGTLNAGTPDAVDYLLIRYDG